jgi:hypothetical protein
MGCWPHESSKGYPFIASGRFTGTVSGLSPFGFDQHGWGLCVVTGLSFLPTPTLVAEINPHAC